MIAAGPRHSPTPVEGNRADRAIRPRRALPGSRAVVGGLLVATSAVAMFAVMRSAGRGPTERYVVARHAIATGAVVQADDLDLVTADLPPTLARNAFRTATTVIGRVVLAPLDAGALVQARNLGLAGRDGVAVVALTIDRADGVGGTLTPGDRVDAYVSYGSGLSSTTRRIVAGAEVVAADTGDGALGATGEVQVAVAIRDSATRIDLVNAAHAGTVTLARVTGVPPEGSAGERAGDDFAERAP